MDEVCHDRDCPDKVDRDPGWRQIKPINEEVPIKIGTTPRPYDEAFKRGAAVVPSTPADGLRRWC